MYISQCKKNEVGKIRVRRRDARIWYLALSIFAAVFLFTFLSLNFDKIDTEVNAANLSNFDPGYIISDYQMGNYTSMTEAEIQAFLTMKNPCDNTDYNYYLRLSANTNYKWHWANGHFVCLSEERFGDGEVIGSGDTAAHIIWQAAQDYRINPQALIVLLQKETGLITDRIPNNGDYRKATGYGCPDTAPCSAQYYGFKNQIRKAAALFRTVLDGGWTNYPLGENYIQYNPNAACGGSVVNIRSLATSALYRYTPYQPNAGALAAGYGTAYCGAYGNRNFYHYFEDWFGGITDDGMVYDSRDYSGTFNILYAGNHTKAVGITEDNLTVNDLDRTDDAEKWTIRKNKSYYTIKNVSTGKVIGVDDVNFENKTNVAQINSDSSCREKWNFIRNEDGTVTIHNVCEPKYVLDLQNGETNVQIYSKTEFENDHQKWVLVPTTATPIEEGTYYIQASKHNKYMGVAENKIVSDSNVQTDFYQKTDGSRHWVFKKVANEIYYTIINGESGLMLGMKNDKVQNKTNIQLCGKDDGCLVNWYIEKYDNDSYYIRSAYDITYVLDLQNGDSNVQIYEKRSNNVHQQWFITKEVPLEEYTGTYNIIYAGNQNKTLSIENGTNVAVMTTKGSDTTQQWKIEIIEDYYVIKNVGTGKVMDVAGTTLANKANVQQFELNKTCEQRFSIEKNKDETLTIHNKCDDKFVLDVHNGISNVQIYTKTSYENDHQKWVLKEADTKDYSGTYQIMYSGDHSKALAIVNNSAENYANALVEPIKENYTGQQWKIEKVDDFYTITNVGTGKLLDVEYGQFKNKSNVWQYALNKTCAQRWHFTKNENGTVTIQNACAPEFVLDVHNGISNVQIYTKTSYANDHQEWLLNVL